MEKESSSSSMLQKVLENVCNESCACQVTTKEGLLWQLLRVALLPLCLKEDKQHTQPSNYRLTSPPTKLSLVILGRQLPKPSYFDNATSLFGMRQPCPTNVPLKPSIALCRTSVMKKRLMGGLTMVMSGDFRQTLPVIH